MSYILGELCLIVLIGFGLVYSYDSCQLSKAREYYDNGKYSLALSECNKCFFKTKKINQMITESKNKINEIKRENEAIDKVKDFIAYMDNLEAKKTRDGIKVNLDDMIFIVKDLKKKIKDFESIDAPENSAISYYLKGIKNSTSYKNMKLQISNELFEDKAKNFVLSAYGSLSTESIITVGNARIAINNEVRELDSKAIPPKLSY